jgi:hypothetical protein
MLRRMGLSTTACVLLGAVALLGCKQDQKAAEDRVTDAFFVRSVQDTAMKNAIIAQHTLFPYHFVPNGDDLNDLGKVDFNVLANHLREHPGELNVRRGDVTKELYEARVKRVRDRLEAYGIPAASIAIADGLPGGPGMASENVIRILKEEEGRSRGSRSNGGADRPVSTGTTGIGARSGTSR